MWDEYEDPGPKPILRAGDVQRFLDGLRRKPDGPAPEPQAPEVARPAPKPRRPGPATSRGRGRARAASVLATLVLLLAVWASTGFFKVEPDQVGVVLRFGRFVDTRGPGLNYHLPYPIETALLPRVTEVNQLRISSGAVSQMLTGDENIVEASAAVFWRIRDPVAFLFNVYDPESTVRVAGESAVRQVIGLNPIQAALSDQRQKIADDAQALLQKLLDSYDTGIQVTQVQLQRVDPPTAVIDAFNDVQRARADQERSRNEAEAYRNDILPRAHGDAERIKQEAEAYRQQVINATTGDADRFLSLYATYQDAREVTARRLYLDTMEEVLRGANKVVIDPSGQASSLVPILPLAEPALRAAVAPGTAAATPARSTP